MAPFLEFKKSPSFDKWKNQLYNLSFSFEVRSKCAPFIDKQISEDRYLDIIDRPSVVLRATDFYDKLIVVLQKNCPDTLNDVNFIRITKYDVYQHIWDVFWNEQYLLDHSVIQHEFVNGKQVEIKQHLFDVHTQIMAVKGKLIKYNDQIVSNSGGVYNVWLVMEQMINDVFAKIDNVLNEHILKLLRTLYTPAKTGHCFEIKETVLEKIQGWFDQLSFLLVTTRCTVDAINVQEKVYNIHYDYSPVKTKILDMEKSLIDAGWVVIRQPKQVILKTVNISFKVRMLANKANGIFQHDPIFSVDIQSENPLPQTSFAQATIERTKQKETVTKNHNELSWNVENMLVKDVARTIKKKTSKVTEETYVLRIQAQFGNTNVSVLSMPIVIETNTNQNPDGYATITWANVCRNYPRNVPVSFVDIEVPWSGLAEMLSNLFELFVGTRLSEKNLERLHEIILTIPCEKTVDSMMITWKQFCKNKFADPNKPFCFFEWFYAAMKLAENNKTFFEKKHIEGFIGKEQAKIELFRLGMGYGLIRFSESTLGSFAVSHYTEDRLFYDTCFYKKDEKILPDFMLTFKPPLFKYLPSKISLEDAFSQNNNASVPPPTGYRRIEVTRTASNNNPPNKSEPNGRGDLMDIDNNFLA